MNEGVEALHSLVIELSKHIGHVGEFLIGGGIGVDLDEAGLLSGLLVPGELREVVVNLVSDLVVDSSLHEVLAVAGLAEHLTNAGAVDLFNLGEPVEGGLPGLSVHVFEGVAALVAHVGNEVISLRLGLE